MTTRTATDVAPVDTTRLRNVRVGSAWEDTKRQTQADGITITVVVRAALADYLRQRAMGQWPLWLPRP